MRFPRSLELCSFPDPDLKRNVVVISSFLRHPAPKVTAPDFGVDSTPFLFSVFLCRNPVTCHPKPLRTRVYDYY